MKIIRKVAFIYLMAVMVGALSSLDPGPPGNPDTPPGSCVECEALIDEDQDDGGPAYQNCLATCENELPINNSIFYLFLAGTVLASYILLKKPKHKKTPM